jgi:hypothetical protein
MKYVLLIIVSFCSVCPLVGQTPNYSTEIKITQREILIGEPIIVSYQLKAPPNAAIVYPDQAIDPRWDIIYKTDTVWKESDNLVVYAQNWEVTSFDTGFNLLPSLSWKVNGEILTSQKDSVRVNYSLKKPPADYHDIQDILQVSPTPPWWRGPLLVGLAFMLLGIMYWLSKQRKKSPPRVIPIAPISKQPLETAREAIQEMLADKNSMPQDLWYAKLTMIIQRYWETSIHIQPGLLSPENIEPVLRQYGIETPAIEVLQNLFEKASQIKFAKQLTAPEEAKADAQFLLHWLEAHHQQFKTPPNR